MRTAKASVLLLALAAAAVAQITTATLDGLVRDPQGALIPRAEVTVVNTQTGQTFRTDADDRGHWAIPSLATATYRVTVTAPGFKRATADNVKMEAGVPATVNLTMEVGAVTETVDVVAGAEVLQTVTATVSTNLTGRQIRDLPIVSRNATDLIVIQPGIQTPAGPRNSTFNGLPQVSVNMTYDGINIQDNLLKNTSGGAFYPIVYPRLDAIEEVSVTTAAAGAESIAEGAVQIKFITKSGTNEFHGGAFVQERNTFFNANYYFNNINGLPRDKIILHQTGANLGGPLLKNRFFFFVNYEVFRFPQTWNASRTVLTENAGNGLYRYRDSAGQIRDVNLYGIAAARNAALPAGVRPFPTSADPRVAASLEQIARLATNQFGSLRDRVTSNNDYNRNNFTFLAPGSHKIDFPTVKLDLNLTEKHHVETVYNINPYRLFPDGINNVVRYLPGTGTVLGSEKDAGQREAFFTAVAAVRSAWNARWTSEIRFGLTGGNVLFSDGITPSMFEPWRGYAPGFGFISNPFTASQPSRRNNPVRQWNGNASWARSGHLINFGGSFSNIREWIQNLGTYITPGITFGVAASDPVNFGATNIFDTVNFPNSTPTDRANAAALYAMLTGRVSAINRSLALDENTRKYGNVPAVQRIRQREYGLYLQDSWKVRPSVTLNYGLRFEDQRPFESLNGTYTRVGYEGLFGVSGVGNLFQPGTLAGRVPQYFPVESSDVTGYPPARFFAPTAGVAWTLPDLGGLLGRLFGSGGQSVLRVGFSVASVREALQTITGSWGNNQGRILSTAVDPTNFPAEFGPPGSVLFRDAGLPARTVNTTPIYPLPVLSTSVNDFDPNLKNRYVQSWNVGFQRSLGRDMALEARYVGNRSERSWTTLNLNEVNIFENGFLDEFRIGQNNLALARAQNPNSNQFAGLPAQRPLPIIQTALGTTTDTNFATLLVQGQAGSAAASISNDAQRMRRLTGAGYAANLFIVNPTTGGAAANLVTNQGGTNYNALQVELKRRMSAGLLLQASYVWSHSLTTGNLLTLRDLNGYTNPSTFDIRHAYKANWIYELPLGAGRRLLGGVQNRFARKAAEGWQIAGVMRLQSGTPQVFTSGRQTSNTRDAGVVLHNLTTRQLQEMMQIRKTTGPNRVGVIYWLPQSLIDNTQAAFEVGGKTLRDLDRSKPYIGPPTEPGQFGHQVWLYGPWLQHWDLSVVKQTRIGERQSIEFRTQFLNAFNTINFFLGASNIGAGFGQTASAYRDVNSTNDPGARVIEFVLRYRF